MPETIKIDLPGLQGQAGLTAWLYADADGTLLNAGGDALTESASTGGRFTFSLAETRSGNYRVNVLTSGGLTPYYGFLLAGQDLVRDVLPEYATAAQVNAEVLDALTTDTFAELAAVPAATSSIKDKITWVFQWVRNKSTQTATQRKLYADDTTTVISTETVSDDGTTFTKGEAS